MMPNRRFLVITVITICFGTFIFNLFTDGIIAFYISVVGTGLVFLAFVLIPDKRGKIDLRQPWTVGMIWNLPYWFFGSFALLDEDKPTMVLNEHINQYAGLGQWIVLLCFTAIFVGYCNAYSTKRKIIKIEWIDQNWNYYRFFIIAVFLYLTSWTARYYYYTTKLYLPFSEYFTISAPDLIVENYLSTAVPIALLPLVWVVYLLTRDRSYRILIILMTCGEFLWAILRITSKAYLVLPFFAPIIPYLIVQRKIAYKWVIASLLVLVFFAYPFTIFARQAYFETRLSRIDALTSATEQLVLNYGRLDFENYSDAAQSRLSGLEPIIHLLTAFDRGVPSLQGYEYYMAFIAIIPRYLWPNKPVISMGAYFTLLVRGHPDPINGDITQVITSTASTMIGSFFWNLGYIGVILSGYSLGWLTGKIYKIINSQLDSISSIVLYLGLLNIVNITESTVISFIALIIFSLAVPVMVNLLVAKPRAKVKI